MAYFIDLFTPETWRSFQAHGSAVSGFRHRQRKAAEQVEVGDIFCCYLVRLSRWCGLLEITSDSYSEHRSTQRTFKSNATARAVEGNLGGFFAYVASP